MDHIIPPVPKWIRVMWYVELVVCLLYLGCIAGSVALINPFVFNGQAVGIFAAAWSVLLSFYVVLTTTCARRGYLKWFHLAWEAFATLFWLVALSNTATLASDWSATSDYDGVEDDSGVEAEFGLLAASAFLAGIQWVFFMLTMIFLAIGCHHCRMGRVDVNGNLINGGNLNNLNNQHLESGKTEMVDIDVTVAHAQMGESLPGSQPIPQPMQYASPPPQYMGNTHSGHMPAGLA